MTSHEMLRTKAKPGYWWVNVAPLGHKPDWREEPIPQTYSDPESPAYLFGYETREFLRKQYK